MELKKVVLRNLDGTVNPGYAPVFEDGLEWVFAVDMNGSPIRVPLESLKAVFFVRTFSGNPEYDPKKSPEALSDLGGNHLLELKFRDGEILVGEVHESADLTRGFFVTVLDPDDNNILIYVNPGALLEPPRPAT